jgi:hypothetical protein
MSHTKDKEDKEKKPISPTIVIILIIGIILATVAGILFLPSLFGSKTNPEYINGDYKAVYNYYVFNKQDDQKWYLELTIKQKPYIIPFYYNPFQVENIYIDNNTMPTMAKFKNLSGPKILYVSIDPLASSKIAIAAFELKRILDTNYDIFNFEAYYGIHYLHEANYTEYPVATCKNALPNRLIMIINVTGENSITANNNCIHINSKDANDSIRVSDAFAYRLLGIIQDSTVLRIR